MNAIVTKALIWDSNRKSFASPSKIHEWKRDDWTKAECAFHDYDEILDPNSKESFCGCGLYGATEIKRVLRYKWSRCSLVFAMECDGNYEAWTGGLRCQKMRPIAIVSNFALANIPGENPMHDYMQTLAAGIKYFTLPDGSTLNVVPYSTIKDWQEESWLHGDIGEYHGD